MYCIDTSALIDVWNVYPRYNFPPLWGKIESLITSRDLQAPDEVYNELKRRPDALLDWARQHKEKLFRPLDESLQAQVRWILQRFPDLAKADKEVPDADPFVVAMARETKATVVSSENKNPPGHKKKIPNACDELGIPCKKFIQIIVENRWILGK